MNILFVCTGNTCRSPMAEHLFRSIMEKEGLPVRVQSAGVSAIAGMPAAHNAEKVLKEKGIEMKHTSQPLTDKLIRWADLILTMTSSHRQMVVQQFPQSVEKVFVLKEYVEDDPDVTRKRDRLNQLYAEVETKQSLFLAEHRDQIESLQKKYRELEQELADIGRQLDEWQHKLDRLIQPEKEEIKLLEQALPDYDISDPFGGDENIYRQSAEEIEQALQKLKKKLE
ncbi:MAG: low molecular weight protein arginine phosphatase [Bacillaceae bacterium]|nr:low molecular weight protein arginine phosphatase [Bacillaceae bacterium]